MKRIQKFALSIGVFVAGTAITNHILVGKYLGSDEEAALTTGSSSHLASFGRELTLSAGLAKQHFRIPTTRDPQRSPPADARAAAAPKSTTADDKEVIPVRLLFPPDEIEWIRNRHNLYWSFFNDTQRHENWKMSGKDLDRHAVINATMGYTKYQEDRDGPWMDFLIAGHPKTGTTTLVANLAKVAPMKVKDFCVSKPMALLHYLYDAWPRKFPEILEEPSRYIPDNRLQLVGSKCPKFIGNPEFMFRYTLLYPRTKLIVGIRHPILWYTSFMNMGHTVSPYTRMELCPYYGDINPITGIPGGISSDRARRIPEYEMCNNECRCNSALCFHRARLHIGIARMGKTALSPEERQLLSPGDADGGANLLDAKVRNPVFIYDQNQMKADSYWDELAGFLGLSYVPNHHYHASHGKKRNLTLCNGEHDAFRAQLMEHSYNMSVWLEEYLLPLGEDPDRPDVRIVDTVGFRKIVRTYREDPCKRLVRDDRDGRFVLEPAFRIDLNRDSGTPISIEGVHRPCKPVYMADIDAKSASRKTREDRPDDERPIKSTKRAKQRRRRKAHAAAAGNTTTTAAIARLELPSLPSRVAGTPA
eukprot:CAMPEP_0197178452 /NCGR_PEP_ID=MMETSP1423-20130617/3728_1 /TAXON_ID=476441 /ORGANISM="Pseudo-nitzschia heimii, Strain UNC1101" /LENGTH=588 /DNA_ID=CAMNT_0042628199 /DNA_START=129 /DNA_END=1892 /DNA_ORIENTATION=-